MRRLRSKRKGEKNVMSRAKDTPVDDRTPPHVALASEALLNGWTGNR
jgi:hypothetical protein